MLKKLLIASALAPILLLARPQIEVAQAARLDISGIVFEDADSDGVFDEGELNRVVEYLAGKQKIPLGKWWRFIRRAPEVWLVNEWSLVRPPIPTVLVLVLPPAGVFRRGRCGVEALSPLDAPSVIVDRAATASPLRAK